MVEEQNNHAKLSAALHAPPTFSVDPALIKSLHVSGTEHYRRLAIFILLYALSATGAYLIARHSHSARWVYLANVPLYLLAAASLHGISLFTHEGVHGILSSRSGWNHFLSAACAMPVLQNFSAYKVLHLQHHNHLGDEGDPDHYANYTRWTWMEFLMHWGRLLIGYPVYIVAIPFLGYQQGDRSARTWIIGEIGCLLVVAILAACFIPWLFLLHGWLLPMLIINTMVNIRGMSQHTFLEEHSDPILGTRSILTNRITAFFMCNENYHLEHHLYPGVPWHNLPRLHQTLRQDLAAHGAPFIPSYFAFVIEFFVKSFRRSPWGKAKPHA